MNLHDVVMRHTAPLFVFLVDTSLSTILSRALLFNTSLEGFIGVRATSPSCWIGGRLLEGVETLSVFNCHATIESRLLVASLDGFIGDRATSSAVGLEYFV
jgi:hypothetical protein